MNTAAEVDSLAKFWRQQADAGAITRSEAGWNIATACKGWPYVLSAWGAECTPAERKKRYGYTESEAIIKKCQVLNGSKGSCIGCQWYPEGQRTRCFDCRGFDKWTIEEATGFALYGDTVNSQWGHAGNWCMKGQIGKDPIPECALVDIFIYKNGKWTHTGLYRNGETCECSNGVQYFEKMQAGRWTHWAVAAPFKQDIKEAEKDMARPGYAEVIAANGKAVNLRAEPTKKAKVLIQVKCGEEVKLEPEPESAWEYVSYKGKTGWMMKEFLKEGGD